MKIFLLTSPLGRREPAVYPLGLASLVPYLRGHDVVGYDANLPGRDWEEGLRLAADADCIAFSFRNVDTTQERDPFVYYPAFAAAVRRARELSPRAIIAVGGAAFSLYPERIMRENPALDLGVILEGEEVFPRSLEAYAAGAAIPGTYVRRGAAVVGGSRATPLDLAAVRAADRTVFPLADYREPFAIGVQTRRGCPGGCAYCTYPGLEGRALRARAVADVVAELEALRAQGVETFTFVDAVWSAPPGRAKEMCRKMIERGLGMRWKAYFDERTFDGELADLALEAGAAEFSFSPDAADDEVLRALGKNVAAADLYRTLAILKTRRKAKVSYSFFIDAPGQKVGTFAATVRFYLAAKRVLGRAFLGASFGNIRVGPGAPLYEEVRRKGGIRPNANYLPRTRRELLDLFYHPSRALRAASRIYVLLWQGKKTVQRWLGRR